MANFHTKQFIYSTIPKVLEIADNKTRKVPHHFQIDLLSVASKILI